MDGEIEVRARIKGDSRKWEDISPATYSCETQQEAYVLVSGLLPVITDVKELRWNWKGSRQGHYVLK